MTAPGCARITLVELTDYAAGELSEAEAAAIEEHLFSCADCGARAAEFDALVRTLRPAMRSAEVGGFVTDAVLNRLAREGVRVRTYALSPGAVVPCAVWDDDQLMALRLRADFGSASEFTLSQRVAGTEVIRVRGHVSGNPLVNSFTPSRPLESVSCRPWRWRSSSPPTRVVRSGRSAATRSSMGDCSTDS